MATVVNKADPSLFHVSVNEPDFPLVNWLHDPSGFFILFPSVPSKYWKLTGGGTDIEEMSVGEKAVVDAAEAAAAKVNAKAQADGEIDGNRGYSKRALAKLMIDEINTLRGWITDFKTEVAAASNLADLRTGVAALPNMPDRTLAQAKTAYKNLVAGTELDE